MEWTTNGRFDSLKPFPRKKVKQRPQLTPVMNATEATDPESSAIAVSTDASKRANDFRFAPYVLALLCFLLPFLTFSCAADRSAHQSISGWSFVAGDKVVVGVEGGRKQTEKVEANPWATTAFVVTCLAIAFSMARGFSASAATGTGAIVALLGLLQNAKDSVAKGAGGLVVVSPAAGFDLALLALAFGVGLNGYIAWIDRGRKEFAAASTEGGSDGGNPTSSP
jgi:hypothetical protein